MANQDSGTGIVKSTVMPQSQDIFRVKIKRAFEYQTTPGKVILSHFIAVYGGSHSLNIDLFLS